jgi:hypothetical protein
MKDDKLSLEEKLSLMKEVADSFAADLENFEYPKPQPSKDRLTYWFPKLQNGLQEYLPKTEVVPYNHFKFIEHLEEASSEWRMTKYFLSGELRQLFEDSWNAVQKLMPLSQDGVFVRTDLASAKHDGPSTYLIKDKTDMYKALARTAEDNEIKFGLFGPIPSAFVFRQFLKLNTAFTAFGGLPIANEWRFFATGKRVECFHFYWPDDAIRDASVPDWKDRLAKLQRNAIGAILPPFQLHALAIDAVRLVGDAETGDAWSVDFAEDVNGKFWLIDMADANRSWHPNHLDSSSV